MMEKQKITVLNVKFDNLTMKEFIAVFSARIEQNKKTFVVTANPEIVMHANADREFMGILRTVDYITPDGIGIVKGAQLLKTPLKERVAGYDMMLELFKEADRRQKRVYLLGAKQEVVETAVKKIQEEYPGLVLAGYHNGYFDLSDERMLEKVAAEKPDIVFVALGFPRQEQWIRQYFEKAAKGLVIGVGGSFDVYSGAIKRAPKFFREYNLEWFYRLLQDPGRFRRMLMLPKFLIEVYKEKAKR